MDPKAGLMNGSFIHANVGTAQQNWTNLNKKEHNRTDTKKTQSTRKPTNKTNTRQSLLHEQPVNSIYSFIMKQFTSHGKNVNWYTYTNLCNLQFQLIGSAATHSSSTNKQRVWGHLVNTDGARVGHMTHLNISSANFYCNCQCMMFHTSGPHINITNYEKMWSHIFAHLQIKPYCVGFENFWQLHVVSL